MSGRVSCGAFNERQDFHAVRRQYSPHRALMAGLFRGSPACARSWSQVSWSRSGEYAIEAALRHYERKGLAEW